MAEKGGPGMYLTSILTEDPRFLFQSPDHPHLHIRKSPDEGKPGEVLKRTIYTRESDEIGAFLNQPLAPDPFFDHAPHTLVFQQESGLPLENKI